MKTRLHIITVYLLSVIWMACLCGCSISLYKPQSSAVSDDVEPLPQNMVTEICICKTANADGSIILWGDREQDGKFFIFAIPNTDNVQAGDDIAITYSEDARLRASHTDSKNSVMYYLKKGDFTLSPISLNIVRQAIDGARKNKYLKLLEEAQTTDVATLATEQLIETAASAEPEYQTDYEVTHEEFYIDTTALSENGIVAPTIYSVSHKGFKTVIVGTETYHLHPDLLFTFGMVEYSASSTSYFGTVHGVPATDTILLYLNSSNHLSAGKITTISTAPNNLYTIQMSIIPLSDVLE